MSHCQPRFNLLIIVYIVKKIIIGLSFIFIVLLVAVAMINSGSYRSKKIGNSQIAPTPGFNRQITFTPISKETQNKILAVLSRPMASLSATQRVNLQHLTTKLPYSSADFEMTYSQKLNHYFVATKTPLAYDRFKEFLRENNALDLYLNGYGIITVTPDPLDVAIPKYEEAVREVVEDPEDNKGQHVDNSNVKGISDENDFIENLKDVGRKLINSPDLSEGEDTPAGGGSPPGQPAIGQTMEIPTTGPVDETGWYFQLPEAPNGEYQIYSCANHRYGQKPLLNVIYTVAVGWKNYTQGGSLLNAGDLNAAGHKSHRWGFDADIVVTDDSATYIYADSYDKNRAVEFGKLFMNTKLMYLIFFNDENVRQAVNAYAAENNLPGEMQYSDGHEDHFHVRLNIPAGPDVSPGC